MFLMRFRSEEKGRPATAAPVQSSRCLSRGSDDCDGAEGERGVRASFGEKDDPAPMNLENSKDCPPSVFHVYCRVYVSVIICNYMERRSGSVEVTEGPTMSWREITTHGDAMIRQNR
ncbi:hypothetical protein GW17_00029710 [Ensete ventricosum]|nr:hypothetical protein GW17_00029710 [Ensete ventricosum]